MVIHNSKSSSSNSEETPQGYYPLDEILGKPVADGNDPEAQIRELANRATQKLGNKTSDELIQPDEWARVLVEFAHKESDLKWAFSRIKKMGLEAQDFRQFIPPHLKK